MSSNLPSLHLGKLRPKERQWFTQGPQRRGSREGGTRPTSNNEQQVGSSARGLMVEDFEFGQGFPEEILGFNCVKERDHFQNCVCPRDVCGVGPGTAPSHSATGSYL